MDFMKQYVLFLSVVVLFVQVSVVSASLLASYGFDEGSGSTANDASGNGHNATLYHSPAWTTEGKFGKCLTFDGVNDYVDTDYRTTLNPYTFSLWFKTTADYSAAGTVENPGPAQSPIGALEMGGGKLLIYELGIGNLSLHGVGGPNYPWPFTYNAQASVPAQTVTVATQVNDGQWHYLAGGMGNNSRAFISLDGGAIVECPWNDMTLQVAPASDIFIGARSNNNSFSSDRSLCMPFTGQIDEVRIYNHALTLSEIQYDMTHGVSPSVVDLTPPSPPAVVRDGAGSDVGYTSLTTQLSANWDAGTDAESDISGYKYAIGTSPGATNVTNGWISNATTNVTKAGLTLSVGTTYYFSVKSVNGAVTPLESLSATNSNGQYIAPPLPAGGVLRVSSQNGRYFTDNSGKAIYLTGSHTWSNFQSWGTHYTVIDFTAHLDWLQSKNHNLIRLWVTDTSWRDSTPGPGACEPQPFVRTGPGNALRGGLKFSLTSFNQAYFDKLSQCVSAAKDRGIYVMVMLFDVWGAGGYGNAEWNGCPYNGSNNVNGCYASQGNALYSMSSPALPYMEAYTRKVIDTVNGYDNVLYEIINEGDNSTKDWQYHFIQYIKDYEAGKPKQHPVGVNTLTLSYQTGSNAEFIGPLLQDGGAWATDPPAANGSKVIIADTDHINSVEPSWVWKSFTRGLNPILMDEYGFGGLDAWYTTAEEEVMRNYMGYTLTYANKMNLTAMTPQNSLSSTQYCLASAGSEYLVYQPGSGSFTLNLSGASGEFSVEWFNPSNGSTSSGGNITGGSSSQQLTPPFSGEAVAYLKAASQTPDTTPPSNVSAVRDGTSAAADSSKTGSLTQLSANWNAATDGESGISGYKYAIGTTAGGTDVTGWTTIGNVLTVTKTNLSLTINSTYYFSVKAINNASPIKLDSESATNSNGQYGTDKQMTVYWKLDEGTGSSVADNSGSGNPGVLNNSPTWTTGKVDGGIMLDGVDDSITCNSLPLTKDNFTMCAWVKATTTHEIDTESTSEWSGTGVGQKYLFWPAHGGTNAGAGVSVGTNGISVYEHGDSYMPPLAVYSGTLGTNWNHIVVVYENKQPKIYLNGALVRTGLTSPRPEVYVSTTVGGANYGYFAGDVDEVKIYPVSLTSQEVLALYNSYSTDTTPPSAPGTVRDGAVAGTDDSFTYSTAALSANWTASTDNESGITNYQFSIGTTPGGTQTSGWATIGTALAVTKTGLSLSVGTTYYFSVRAVNGAGLSGPTANSNGQYVNTINTTDTTPPSLSSTVRDGTSATADTGYTASTTELSASWSASADAESGVSKYWYAIGDSPAGTDVADWTDNGVLTSVTKTGLTLTVGTTYYFSVKAENGVGLQSSPANSNGQCVVSSVEEIPPVISDVQSTNITASAVTISWTTDRQATSRVEYGLTAAYGYLTAEDISLVTDHSVVITGLTAGQTCHYRVISKDSNGRTGTSVDFTFTTLSTQTEVTETKAYPNPCDFSNGQVVKFKVSALADSKFEDIKIYTMSGKLVKKLAVGNGITEITWDGTNESGQKVVRGIYIYKIKAANGSTTTGKLAVVH